MTSVGHLVQPSCRSRVTYSKLHRTLSRWVLNISREGEICYIYWAVPGNLWRLRYLRKLTQNRDGKTWSIWCLNSHRVNLWLNNRTECSGNHVLIFRSQFWNWHSQRISRFWLVKQLCQETLVHWKKTIESWSLRSYVIVFVNIILIKYSI